MDKMMEWAKLLKNNQTNLIQCSLQIVDGKNGIESYTEPQILNGENFCIKYSFLGKKLMHQVRFAGIPVEGVF